MLFCGRTGKTLRLQAKKIVECYKQGLTQYLVGSSKDNSTEINVDYGGQTVQDVSEVKNIINWDRPFL